MLEVKDDSWIYLSVSKLKPEFTDNESNAKEECDKWSDINEKAKAGLILYTSQIVQIKNCKTSLNLLRILEDINQSKSPAQ